LFSKKAACQSQKVLINSNFIFPKLLNYIFLHLSYYPYFVSFISHLKSLVLLKPTIFPIYLRLPLFILTIFLIFSACTHEETRLVHETEIVLDGNQIFSFIEYTDIDLYENFDIYDAIDHLLKSGRFDEASIIFQRVIDHLYFEDNPCRRAHLLLNIQGLLLSQDRAETYIEYVKNYLARIIPLQ